MPVMSTDSATAYLSLIYGGAFMKMYGQPITKDKVSLVADEVETIVGFKFDLSRHIPDPKSPDVFEDIQLTFDIDNVSSYHELVYGNNKHSFIKSE